MRIMSGEYNAEIGEFWTQPVPHPPSLVTHRPYTPHVGTGKAQSVGFSTTLWTGRPKPGRIKMFLLQSDCTDFEARPPSYSKGTVGLAPQRVKRPGRDADDKSPSCTKVKNE